MSYCRRRHLRCNRRTFAALGFERRPRAARPSRRRVRRELRARKRLRAGRRGLPGARSALAQLRALTRRARHVGVSKDGRRIELPLAALLGAPLWLLGLYFGSPAIARSGDDAFVDRLRNALTLGVAIPLLLGCHQSALSRRRVGWRWRRASRSHIGGIAMRRRSCGGPVPYVTIAALALVAWPQLMRPLLDGDSVSYHLPNAASWVQSHGIWTTVTRYWWYPPASELFASGLYATGGPFALGWAGFGALALVGFRVAAWARAEFGASPLLADALAAAIVTAMPLALQGGSLQNDVWLAAFWLETLVAAAAKRRRRVDRNRRMCAPQTRRVDIRRHRSGRDARALRSPGSPASRQSAGGRSATQSCGRMRSCRRRARPYGSGLGTSIVAHGLPALAELIRVLLLTSPFSLIALVAALAAPFALRGTARALGWCAFAAAVLFVALPFGYDNGDLQLATGASVRFAAPAIALGGLLLVVPALRAPRAAGDSARTLRRRRRGARRRHLCQRRADARRLAVAALALAIAAVPQTPRESLARYHSRGRRNLRIRNPRRTKRRSTITTTRFRSMVRSRKSTRGSREPLRPQLLAGAYRSG